MNFAASRASSAVFTSFTNPALPRPPAYTCAFTTHICPPNFLNASAASSAVIATSAGGTGTPASPSSFRDWYSWIFISPGRIAGRKGNLKPHRWHGRLARERVPKGNHGAHSEPVTRVETSESNPSQHARPHILI